MQLSNNIFQHSEKFGDGLGGNAFAKNSHSSSDIDTLGFLEQRDEKYACGYRPERVAGSGETTCPAPETKMPLPFQAKVMSRIPRFTDRCSKVTESHRNSGV